MGDTTGVHIKSFKLSGNTVASESFNLLNILLNYTPKRRFQTVDSLFGPYVYSDIHTLDHIESNESVQFQDVESQCYRASTPDISQHVSHVLPQAIDNHFHLDRTRRKILDVHSLATSEDIIQHTPPPKRSVNVIGGVEIYWDSSFHPPIPSSDSPFKFAVGIHPRHMQHPFLIITSPVFND